MMHRLGYRLKIALLIGLALVGLIFVFKNHGREIEITKGQNDAAAVELAATGGPSPLSGLPCAHYERRPLAVVLANDPSARPLSGLSQADLVVEMPVITGSITRLIAFYVCHSPEEIGSLRSARHDFIPLAMGFDAILAHWGGSHFALDKLNNGVMDNLNALTNPYNAFFRKADLSAPDNGFTGAERLLLSAEKLGYRLEGRFSGYPRYSDTEQAAAKASGKKLTIDYAYPYNVEYRYLSQENSYARWRAGKPERDELDSQQIKAKNVVVMEAFSRQIEGQYNDLDIEGEGSCWIYQNGQVIEGVWHKDKNKFSSKLYFLDRNGEEVPFVPGQIWIEIVEPSQNVLWQ